MTTRIAQDTPDTTTVLVVDDEPSNVALLPAHLQAEGRRVIAADRSEGVMEKTFTQHLDLPVGCTDCLTRAKRAQTALITGGYPHQFSWCLLCSAVSFTNRYTASQ